MPGLKNQHFVPKCLLKPFTEQGKGGSINLYNIRHDRLIQNASVKGQCARDYLYGKDGKIEKSLSRIESSFGLTRDRVIAGRNRPLDLHDLNFFTYLQFRRTTQAVARLKDFLEQMRDGVFEGTDTKGFPTDHWLIMQSLNFCLRSRHYIEDLKIRLIENRTNTDFVISDDPAIFANRFAAQRLGEASFGVSSSGLFLTMPLSPRYAIICYDGLIYTVPDLVSGRIVVRDEISIASLNELQNLKAAENIYFQDWERRDSVRTQFMAVKDNRPAQWASIVHFVPIREGEVVNGGHRSIRGEEGTYRVGTLAEAKEAGTSLVQTSNIYPVPSRWFPPLRFRSKFTTFYEGTGVGHVRKAEWLRTRQK